MGPVALPLRLPVVLHDPTRGSPPSRGLRNTTRAMAFSSLRGVRLEKDVFRSLVGRWCNKHPWSSVPFSSYATSMKPRAVGPSLLAPPPEGGLLSFTSMRPCGSHRPPLRFFYMAPSSSSSFSSSLFRRCGCVCVARAAVCCGRRAARIGSS